MQTSKFNKKGNGNIILLVLHSLIIILYTCRALFSYYSISKLEYYLSFALMILYVFLILANFDTVFKMPKEFLLFFAIGLFCFIFSLITKGFTLAVMGFASLFLNLFLWINNQYFTNKYDFHILRSVFLTCMVINSIVSIYQFFIDASFFGIITGMYGDESIMGLNNVTRRTVGFMGSPQSFSASIGVSMFVAYTLPKKRLKWIIIILLSIGGLLSNSRAFGIALILFLIFILSKYPVWKIIAISIFGIFLYFVVSLVVGFRTFDFGVIMRTFNFSKWAASDIYFTSLSENNLLEWLFGKGYGLKGWNSNAGVLAFDFSSTESYAISVISQIGLIGLFAYFAWIIRMFIRNKKNKLFFFMLLYIVLDSCFTPALCGFAFSYVAWFAIIHMSKNYCYSQKEVLNVAYQI